MRYSSFKLFNLRGSLFSYIQTDMEKFYKKVNLDQKTQTENLRSKYTSDRRISKK
jgi:hypothetical protein